MDLGLHDRSVVVLAGTSGLGLGAASSLVEAGATVTVCSRRQSNLDEARAHLEALDGGEVRTVTCDITDPDDIAALVEGTVAATGGLDHLVASTGGVPPGGLADLDDREWYQAFDLLVMSLVWTIDAARDHLAESPGGSITVITSTSVREPLVGLTLSNVVRRGVIGLVKTAALELAPDVRVNAVLPSAFDTPRIQELIDDAVESGRQPDREAARAAWVEDIPLSRLGDPRELGDMIAVLTSDRASFVTGACLPVDGGRLRS
ncbi:MAG: SDR family oxidoreductase [Halobacteriota archaeon]